MLDVLKLEWPVKGKSVTTTRFDAAQNGEAHFVPFKFPRQYGRKCDNEKTIGKVGNAGEPRLQTALERAVTGSVRITKLQSATKVPYRKIIMRTKLVMDTTAVSLWEYCTFLKRNAILVALLP